MKDISFSYERVGCDRNEIQTEREWVDPCRHWAIPVYTENDVHGLSTFCAWRDALEQGLRDSRGGGGGGGDPRS